jgi:hypothetical protein
MLLGTIAFLSLVKELLQYFAVQVDKFAFAGFALYADQNGLKVCPPLPAPYLTPLTPCPLATYYPYCTFVN